MLDGYFVVGYTVVGTGLCPMVRGYIRRFPVKIHYIPYIKNVRLYINDSIAEQTNRPAQLTP